MRAKVDVETEEPEIDMCHAAEFWTFDMEICSNRDADVDVYQANVNVAGDSDGNVHIDHVVNWVEIDQCVEGSIEMCRHWTNVKRHVDHRAAHHRFGSDGKVSFTSHLDVVADHE